jgi:ABC-type molybdenum transport system ATPase subunit/photorepair protein PhrA
VLLARAVAPGPELLFLDEPTAGLDPPSRRRTLALLQALAESGMTLVLVTHHEDELLPAVRHVLRLEGGRVACCGPR